MRTAQDFLREAIQLVVTKKLLISFKVEEGTDWKLGEIGFSQGMVSFQKQVKRVLTGQTVGNMDATYTLVVQDLLRGNALAMFNNEQTTFKEQMSENLKHCFDAVMVHVFPNKAYKLQKWYIWYMMHNPRHVTTCKWIASVINLKNYIMEFPMPAGVEARKMDQEEILEVLENRIPISWKFQIDKEGFNASSSTIKEFTKTCICYKEYKPKMSEKQSVAHRSHSKREGKQNTKHRADEMKYHKWGQAPP
eukprot:15366878-Ditylum_brightwellii.AAC.1